MGTETQEGRGGARSIIERNLMTRVIMIKISGVHPHNAICIPSANKWQQYWGRGGVETEVSVDRQRQYWQRIANRCSCVFVSEASGENLKRGKERHGSPRQ